MQVLLGLLERGPIVLITPLVLARGWRSLKRGRWLPGSPFKTDKRDARALARLLRAGELTAVYVPEATDEAIRDLCRARTDAVDDQRRCRHRLKAFLMRHGYRYQGKANWSQPDMRYLRELVLPHPALKAILLEEYLQGSTPLMRGFSESKRRCSTFWKPGALNPRSKRSWPFADSSWSPPWSPSVNWVISTALNILVNS